jgi:hypothetical protein
MKRSQKNNINEALICLARKIRLKLWKKMVGIYEIKPSLKIGLFAERTQGHWKQMGD